MGQQGEPSVEEILDSIKKVIARDSEERSEMIAERRSRRAAPADTSEPVDEQEAEDVLELGNDLGEEIAVDGAASSNADAYASDEDDDDADGLTRGDTRQAMRDNFAALAMLSQPGKQPQIVRQGETSLEGLVRDMLRPMLAEWLDNNLPGMVEDLVKAEIARIAGKKS
ncbi:DUF2497 domain-containing protein [Erythrobacter aquimaris]|uniref:DUF2497 domain-containing protein n=1 Tax=Qipengyuania aquimaris TaxID=255984 RepID=A0A6I4TP69_9SPHN|nr:DUF2497 domain-containing protein [Qipengyuania aquimaris]MXO96901.1 DUF2497 domain-containing protein [Qipengyuania aquimaris]